MLGFHGLSEQALSALIRRRRAQAQQTPPGTGGGFSKRSGGKRRMAVGMGRGNERQDRQLIPRSIDSEELDTALGIARKNKLIARAEAVGIARRQAEELLIEDEEILLVLLLALNGR